MLAVNEILQNRYRIVGQLGNGGMGTVYEAKDRKRFGKNIAVKEILINAGEEANLNQQNLLKQAFEREAKILAGLEHETFPQVIDYFVENGRQFLVMELVSGDNLSSRLEKCGKAFELDEVLDWADQILDALDYLHTLETPVFHRDIKPQNLKLNLRGKIKLLDFGIAKAADAGFGLTLTNQTFIAATLHYSPLEQIIKVVDANYREFLAEKFGVKFEYAFANKTDGRSDIYALGATLYHFLTGTLPVDSMKRAIKIFDSEADPLPNPQELNKQIPAAVSEWILKAMEIKMENRFANVKEMQAALREILKTKDEREEGLNRAVWLEELEKLKRERESLEAERRQIEAERRFFTNRAATGQNLPETFTDVHKNYYGETCKLLSEQEINVFGADSFVILNDENDSPIEIQNDEIEENSSAFLLTETGFEFENETEEKLPETSETIVPEPPKRKRIWLISAAAIILFALFGTGVGAWFLQSEADANFDVSEINIETVKTFSETQNPPTVETEAEQTVISNDTATEIVVAPKKPEVKPTPAKTPVPPIKDKKKIETNNPCQPVTVDCINRRKKKKSEKRQKEKRQKEKRHQQPVPTRNG